MPFGVLLRRRDYLPRAKLSNLFNNYPNTHFSTNGSTEEGCYNKAASQALLQSSSLVVNTQNNGERK